MHCDEAGGSLAAYLYKDLPAAELAAVEKHLEQCQDCAAQARQMRAVMGWLDRAASPAGSVSSVPLLVRQAAHMQQASRRWRWSTVGVGAAAAAALVALITLSEVRWQQGALVVQFAGGRPVAPDQAVAGGGTDAAARLQQADERVARLAQEVERLRQSVARLALQQERFLVAWERERAEGVNGGGPPGLVANDFDDVYEQLAAR